MTDTTATASTTGSEDRYPFVVEIQLERGVGDDFVNPRRFATLATALAYITKQIEQGYVVDDHQQRDDTVHSGLVYPIARVRCFQLREQVWDESRKRMVTPPPPNKSA